MIKVSVYKQMHLIYKISNYWQRRIYADKIKTIRYGEGVQRIKQPPNTLSKAPLYSFLRVCGLTFDFICD